MPPLLTVRTTNRPVSGSDHARSHFLSIIFWTIGATTVDSPDHNTYFLRGSGFHQYILCCSKKDNKRLALFFDGVLDDVCYVGRSGLASLAGYIISLAHPRRVLALSYVAAGIHFFMSFAFYVAYMIRLETIISDNVELLWLESHESRAVLL